MKYLNGKILQKKLLNEIKETVALLEIKPTLAVISIDTNQVGQLFFKQIKKMCELVGYELKHYHYEDISLETLLNLIKKLNNNPEITSILIENPIPKHLLTPCIRNAILPRKDIEGITDINKIKIQNQEGGFLPGTVLGMIHLLDGYNIDVKEKNVVIINRSDNIGKPLSQYFLNKNCTVTICHSKTKNLEHFLKEADILITGVGKANLISPKLLKENSVVLDIGIEYLDGTYYGDIDLSNDTDNKSIYIARSIGGIGPMTISAIAENILKSYYLSKEDKENELSE